MKNYKLVMVAVFDDGRQSKQYDEIFNFENGIATVRLDEKYGLINEDGEEIVTPMYDWKIYFKSNGLAIVEKDGKYGLINRAGKEVVIPKYDGIGDFINGFAIVRLNNKYGIINEKGEEIIELKFDRIYRDGIIKIDNKYGLLNENCEEIVPPEYDDINSLGKDYFELVIDEKHGLIDRLGNEVIPLKYAEIKEYDENYFKVAVMEDGKYYWGLVDKSGNEVICPKYEEFEKLKDNLFKVCAYDGSKGFVNIALNKTIEPMYTKTRLLDNDLIFVVLHDQCGVIDTELNERIEPKYDSFSSLVNDSPFYTRNGKFCTRTPEEIAQYREKNSQYLNLFKVSLKEKKGVINDKDQVVIPLMYDNIEYDDEGYFKTSIDGKIGFIDKEFNEIFKPVFLYGKTKFSQTEFGFTAISPQEHQLAIDFSD